MFRKMKRQDRVISNEDALCILKEGKFGVMSLIGNQDIPYGVPLHYVMIGDSLYFHSAKEEGLKSECLKNHPRVCFTVVQTEDGVKCNSVIVFGHIESADLIKHIVLEKIVEKFVPFVAWETAKSGIPFALSKIQVYELKLEQISGKWIDKPEG